jgi:hypothetical protein
MDKITSITLNTKSYDFKTFSYIPVIVVQRGAGSVKTYKRVVQFFQMHRF